MPKEFQKRESAIFAKDVMSSPAITIGQDETIKDLENLICEKRISGVPVVNKKGILKGIVSKTDIIINEMEMELNHIVEFDLKFIINETAGSTDYSIEPKKDKISGFDPNLKLKEIMTKKVHTASPSTKISDIASTLLKYKIHRIVVTEKNKVVGVVTSMDLMKLLL